MMIFAKKNGAELADKLAAIREIERSEAYAVAKKMRSANFAIDQRLAEARRTEREGKALIEQGVSLEALDEILRAMGGVNPDAAASGRAEPHRLDTSGGEHMAKITETTQPKITRIKGLQTVEIGGVPKMVQEIVYMDWGPKLGVSKGYILAPEDDAPKADLDTIDRVLRRYGLEIDREALCG